jgi:peptidoglycan-associated lipoprotein
MMLNPGAMETPFESIFFGFDEYTVRASERGKLERLSAYLRDNPSARLVAEGHTDWRGTEAYNMGLGDRRANAVKNYLVSGLNVNPSRVDVLSKGELEATAETGKQDAVAQQDRRVDIYIAQ